MERQKLDISIPRVPEEAVKRWESRGIVNDSVGHLEPVCNLIHILIGADYVSQFLIEKKEV